MEVGLPTRSSPAILRSRFRELVAQWKDESQFLSSATQMAMLRPYQRIIGMGPEVVPMILEELNRECDFWFWALESITDVDPVPSDARGHVAQMQAAWLSWGRERGLLHIMKRRES